MTVAVSAGLAPALWNAELLCDDLCRQGWSVQTIAGRGTMLDALGAEIGALKAQAALEPAGVGRAVDHTLARDIRRDHIHWLDGVSLAQQAYLAFTETLRLDLNRRLMLGLWRYEAHYALYETGGFYKPHFDAFRGARNRLVSTVLYLNENWDAGDGGLLRLYGADGKSVDHEVVPSLGTIAVFLSEEILHEVTAARRPRASIAGWFRCNDALQTPVLNGPGLADTLS